MKWENTKHNTHTIKKSTIFLKATLGGGGKCGEEMLLAELHMRVSMLNTKF